MFKKKKILLLLAAAALVTGCGGGGGGDSATATGSAGAGSTTSGNTHIGSGSTGTPAADSGSGTPASSSGSAPTTGGNASGNTGTDVVTTPPANNPLNGSGTTAEPQLRGYLSIVANQVVYIKSDRSIYHAVPLNQFESTEGMYDAAAGSKNANAGGYVPVSAVGPAAPIAAFGLRVNRFVQRSTEAQGVASQTVVGRVAVSLSERNDSPHILAGEVAEGMRFVIDKVEMTIDDKGELISVRALAGAQMQVEGRNAAGVEVRDTIPVPAGAVRLQSMTEVLDHYGDDSSVVLLLDLEAAFSQAAQKLVALEDIRGHFSMQMTMTQAQIIRPSAAASEEFPAHERKELVGQAITVGNQPAVNGAGISGNAWVRMDPPVQQQQQ